MRKTLLFTAMIAVVAGALAYSYVKPDALQTLFKSEELYNARIADASAMNNTPTAAGTETTPPTTAPATTASTTPPAESAASHSIPVSQVTPTTSPTTSTPADAATATTPDTASALSNSATSAGTEEKKTDGTVSATLPTPTATTAPAAPAADSATPAPAEATKTDATTTPAGDSTAAPDTATPAATTPAADDKAASAPSAEPKVDLAVAMEDHVLGSPSAPLTVYDYSSMSCPHCANFHNTIFPKVKQYYIDTGKVRWVIRTFPHNDPGLRAEMLQRCVPSDQYMKLRDMIFENQERWAFSDAPLANLMMLVKVAGIDQKRFDECTKSKVLENVILKIAQDGTEKYKIISTPTFIFNDGTKKLEGAGSYESFAYEMDTFLENLKDTAKAQTQSTPIPAGKL